MSSAAGQRTLQIHVKAVSQEGVVGANVFWVAVCHDPNRARLHIERGGEKGGSLPKAELDAITAGLVWAQRRGGAVHVVAQSNYVSGSFNQRMDAYAAGGEEALTQGRKPIPNADRWVELCRVAAKSTIDIDRAQVGPHAAKLAERAARELKDYQWAVNTGQLLWPGCQPAA